MKKWLSLLAVLSLSFVVGRCDFSEDDEDVVDEDWTEETDTAVPDDSTGPVACTAGEQSGWFWVKVLDDLTNPSLDASDCQAGNPGADIDCIGIDRGGDYVAWANSVYFNPWADAVCDNDKADPEEVTGAQDGQAGNGTYVGYFSLNGGDITVDFDNGEELLCGDIVYIVEMDSGIQGSQEKFSVELGQTDEGPWAPYAADAIGIFELEVDWEW